MRTSRRVSLRSSRVSVRLRREETTVPPARLARTRVVTRTTSSREEAFGEFAEGVVEGGADGQLLGHLLQFVPGRGLHLVGGEAEGHPEGESGLGGVGQDAGEFGELVDELLDALLALPVEVAEGDPDAQESADRAEERGQRGLSDHPQDRHGRGKRDGELARCDIESRRRDPQFQSPAEGGLPYPPVDAPEAASAAAGGLGFAGLVEPGDEGGVRRAARVQLDAGDAEHGGEQRHAHRQPEGVRQHHSASRVARWASVAATPKACGMGWPAR